MIIENISVFCERNKKYTLKFQRILKLKELNAVDYENIFEMLCELLLDPDSTKDVADCFPQFLPVFLSTITSIEYAEVLPLNEQQLIHERNCVILAKLVDMNPDILIFVLKYFDRNPAPFESIRKTSNIPVKKRKQHKKQCTTLSFSDYDIVLASYRILKAATTHFKHKWNWSKFYIYLIHIDAKVKWVALKCIAIILNMSESLYLSYAKLLISNIDTFLIDQKENYFEPVTFENLTYTEDIFKNIPFMTVVAGVVLPIFHRNTKEEDLKLVSVSSMEESLESLTLAIASKKCICLQGTVGCGKTTLVEYLAKVTGHDSSNFVKVQLGDQTDSKMLLGMYRCTDIPGEFIWQPGVLTQAVLNGKWLLLEDIDSAALDVASVLSNLLESGTLSVPGYRDNIYAKSGFQLFVTQRLISSTIGVQKQISGASNLLQKHWLCINVESFSRNELITMIQTLFPVLSTVASRMVDVFLLFSMSIHDGKDNSSDHFVLKTGRQTSTRDLMKWCFRAVIDFDVSSPNSALKIFQDAIDIFCCSVADQGQRLNLTKAVADKLGIIQTKAEYFCNIYKPFVSLLPGTFIAGKVKLSTKKSQYAKLPSKVNFSFTRPSACLLERIACCVSQKEPVLLVGETGTGKTSSVQYLARSIGHKLIVINMNQQSECADLLGGYKPVDLKFLIAPIREEFEILFRSYFAIEPNKKFLEHISLCYTQRKWKALVTLMNHSTCAALKRFRGRSEEKSALKGKRKSLSKKEDIVNTSEQTNRELLIKWERIAEKLKKLELQVKAQYSLAFSFIEGSLVKALREGQWVLLDEINLANAETLECLSGLLEGSSGSLSLLERGDNESVERHPDFTIFACMNPATDIGKKDLPIGLRNRFTEFYVDELTERSDLQLLVNSYLKGMNLPVGKEEAIVKFYLNVRKEATSTLFDGTGHKPHYSLRTLCRALSIAASNPCGNVSRSLYEAFCLSFLTQLNYDSYPIVQKMIVHAILDNKNIKAILEHPLPKPRSAYEENYTCFEGYWIVRGTLLPDTPKNYILTKTVRRNLKDLVRVVSIGKIPVLLQGDTSVGKTSLITYLAKASGHVCVRINNHEHTDLQEYIGSYVADERGKLVFREGILVEAMRKGYWIILDELNLAPSDVLEALNRVLDDNRELFIPETQQVIKAHDNFMLFATQNPPGLYGGRKVLSRAFRNRFVELHFDEIPADELRIILHERCKMPESYCKQVINVMTDLQIRRKSTAAFAGKHGFITLRDLFRWGERYRLAPDVGEKLYDWNQHLADEGYLVLAARVRKSEETDEIRQVIKKHLRRDVDPDALFSLSEKTSPVTRPILDKILTKDRIKFRHIVWTYHMRKMAVLVMKSCQFKEPVLLVGETGCGKTTVCQLIASINGQAMQSINCHMHTESSDFLGNLRPVREHSSDMNNQKFFEWVDGPLITAMRNGDLFLADEISLADDSVLERLNSLLEPERNLLLAEKGMELIESEEDNVIRADDNFIFIGTMNPGGDYGKKELSPALRNRFTEIWCEPCVSKHDLHDIIVHNLRINTQSNKESIAKAILAFIEWLPTTDVGKKLAISIRDVLTWVNFINISTSDEVLSKLSISDAYCHGACLTYIDGLGSGLTASEKLSNLQEFRDIALDFIQRHVKDTLNSEACSNKYEDNEVTSNKLNNAFGIEPFYILKGPYDLLRDEKYTFSSPTTKTNALKLLRALQLKKAILLEGSPGVGKTSIVSALAKASGHALLRINLSDQTDISDLFGADLPVEGGQGGEFAWRDGPFLRALKVGDWILLDELNLASQSVLEGLNACFDHRGQIYIPELGKTFDVKPGTRLFGCQNPLKQGGARRGLPKSFLNRFTQIFVDALTEDDLTFILGMQFPELSTELLRRMVRFNGKLAMEVGITFAHVGSPWEMNLRDISRWCELMIKEQTSLPTNNRHYNPGNSVELIYVSRMRTQEDKQKVRQTYKELFSTEEYPLVCSEPFVYVTEEALYVDEVLLSRSHSAVYDDSNLLLLRNQKATLKSLMQCVSMNWMCILVGASGCGKSNVVRLLASLVGQKLKCIAVNSAMDTTEILGGFEQTDYNRHLEELLERTEHVLVECLKRKIHVSEQQQINVYHDLLEQIRRPSNDDANDGAPTFTGETQLFLQRTRKLSTLISKLKSFDATCERELQEIERTVKSLSSTVEKERCLNAGGKFEWVDSTLVKCLRDGTWLLIDQVNLCSPAVLDRLNGLLEPNGVLTIGERGVDAEGNVVTVKPHENFRLFLAMDPQYGEISRAMRNRGVEIYMLCPKENVNYNCIDVRSMLYNYGVTKRSHQDALLEIYQRMSREIVTLDRFNVIDLMHSAFLLARRLARGFSAKQAIKKACIDVYVKARSTGVAQVKECFVSKIEESIDASLERDTREYLDLDGATWSTRNLLDNSKLTIVRQDGFFLRAAVRMCADCGGSAPQKFDSSYFDDFVAPLTNERAISRVDVSQLIPHLLLQFYERSTLSDVAIRKLWTIKVLEANNASRDLWKKNEALVEEISSFKFRCKRESLPWDVELAPKMAIARRNVDAETDANKLALLLYLRTTIERDESALCELRTDTKKDKKKMSVKEYSNAVYHGKISSKLKNQALIVNFAKFIDQLISYVDGALRDDDLTITREMYVELRRNLKWCNRFLRSGERTLINRSAKSGAIFEHLEDTALLLRVQYKWLSKFLLGLFGLARDTRYSCESATPMERLSATMKEIDEELFSAHDPYRGIIKKIRKHLSSPLPHSCERSMDLHARLRRISRIFLPWDNATGGNDRTLKQQLKILLIQSEEALTVRCRLISLWVDVYSTSAIPNDAAAFDAISEIEGFCESRCLALRTPTEISSVVEEAKECRPRERVQLWPIYEYAFLLLAQAAYGEICRETRCMVNSLDDILQNFAFVASIPADLVATLKAIATPAISADRMMFLASQLCVSLWRFSRHTYAVNNGEMLLHWRGICDDNEANASSIASCQISKASRFTGGAVLINLVLDLVLRSEEASKKNAAFVETTLETFTTRSNQLRNLNNILWHNSVAFTSKRYSFADNDFNVMKFYLNLYVAAIEKMYSEHDVDKLIKIATAKKGKLTANEIESTFDRCYVQPMEKLRKIGKQLENAETLDRSQRGKAWMLLGYVEILIFANFPHVDPVHKVTLKLEYLQEDIDDLEKSIYANTLQAYLLQYSTENEHVHPRYSQMKRCLEEMIKERDSLRLSQAYRPSSSDFVIFSGEVSNFRDTMSSYEIIRKHAKRLTQIASKLEEDRSFDNAKDGENALKEAETWYLSVERFSQQIESKYLDAYPDMVLPLLVALTHLKEGVSLLMTQVERRLCSIAVGNDDETLETSIHNLIRYPTVGPGQQSLLELINLCTSDHVKAIIGKGFRCADTSASVGQQFKILKCGLYELYNYVILKKGLDTSLWRLANELLAQVVLLWKRQTEHAEKREAEKENLYRNKSASGAHRFNTEEEETLLELRHLFPTYRDFGDMENLSELNDAVAPEKAECEELYANVISNDDVEEIQQLHCAVVTSFVKCKWLFRDNDSSAAHYVGPLMRRYEMVGALLKNLSYTLDEGLTAKLYTSLNFLVGHASAFHDESAKWTWKSARSREKSYDFYRDSNVQEVRQCLSLGESILNRTNELLSEWPEHPTLRSIKSIVERIYRFPVASPVARFLTGLELLLVKMHQWEENAHRGVSLSQHIFSLTEQIISWRKLELACWKGCLDAAFERERAKSSKWWFFLYALIENYAHKSHDDGATSDAEKAQERLTKETFTESLERFIGEASLAEFEARLHLLLTFHCHVLYFEAGKEKDELLSILWNVYNYYKQFVDEVRARIAALKAPIEKRLKDFVKIARWNDINYWSVKETVEKTHRTLHKFVKEYEKALRQSVSACLTVMSESCNAEGKRELKNDCEQTEYIINPEDFTVAKGIDVFCQIDISPVKSDLLSKARLFLTKSKRLCKSIILMCSYPSIRVDIENFIHDFMEESAHLRGLEVDRTLPKAKQRSSAKSILQQKKMTLANYFKTLNLMGLSYRTGILTSKNNADRIRDFAIPPLDLFAVKCYFKLRNVDQQMLTQWSNCDKYYYKSLVKLNALNATLRNAQNDLGPQNIERCKGFSVHVMLLANKQRKRLAKLFDRYAFLRLHLSDLSQIDDVNVVVPRQSVLRNSITNIRELLVNLEVVFQQIISYLQYCANESDREADKEICIFHVDALPAINSAESNEILQRANSLLKESLNAVRAIADYINGALICTKVAKSSASEEDVFFGSNHLRVLENSFAQIERQLEKRVSELIDVFSQGDVTHPIVETMKFIESRIRESVCAFKETKSTLYSEEEATEEKREIVDRYRISLEDLIRNVLLVIERKYKNNRVSDAASLSDATDTQNSDHETDGKFTDDFERNKFKERLVESLKKEVKELKLDKICKLFGDLLTCMHRSNGRNEVACRRSFAKCLPIIKQYLLLVQFYLNEQVASFRVTCKLLYLQLNVFLDLATNGFCIPKDLDVEEGDADESQDKTQTGGMGLGEGEGQKDVSERIESEDQLEDAQRPGDERQNDEEKDCKEEETGIEMSENFDGKLQDVEREENEEGKDEDDDDDDDDDEDAEKEMGETEENAEQLDKEIWGDEESEDERNQPKDTEEQGRGEETGERELTAGNRDKEQGEGERDEDGEDREQQKKDIDEMNEAEVNDDQINPYHGKHQPPPEPEPLDLPDDVNLDDDDDAKEENPNAEENPFDIDEMKESKLPPDQDVAQEDTIEEEKEKDKETRDNDDSSDEEGDKEEQQDEQQGEDSSKREDVEKEEKANEDADSKNNSEQPKDQTEENRNEEEDVDMEAEEKPQEKATPSIGDASREADAAEQTTAQDGSRDNVAQESPTEEKTLESTGERTRDENDNQGVGQSQSEEQENGHSESSVRDASVSSQQQNLLKQMEKRKKPGTVDENRTLLDKVEPRQKKLKMIHTQERMQQDDQREEESTNREKEAIEMCQHIQNSDKFDDYTMDAATEDQTKQQQVSNEEEDEAKEALDDSMDVDVHRDEDEKQEENVSKENAEKVAQREKEEGKKNANEKGQSVDDGQLETAVEIEGEVVQTVGVERSRETTFHTNLMEIEKEMSTTSKSIESTRFEVEKMLSEWIHVPTTEEATLAWNHLSSCTDAAARDLSEKLRLVLEPTQASRLRGDYRTGKRINMRKIIPYIASQFRKDKIWLRRTRPSKRDYQIVLALDDSSSMADNHSKELAFESLALIGKAMTYLEAGQLCVISFGEQVSVLHPLGETFNEQSGSRLMQEMRFEQKKTMVGQLVDFTVDMFESQPNSSNNAKLVVVLSDGRGIFSEGMDKVNRAVRRAKLADIFLVFIIVDNPVNKDSILDIRMPVFEGGKLLGIRSYMDSFPFPFYMILRDINMLPGVLSDALRQWFEVVGKIDT